MAGLSEGSLRHTVSALVGAGLVTISLTARAVQAPPPAKPMVPAAAGSIAANPDSFLGQFVTIHAAVDEILTPTAFTVDQDRTRRATPILVVSPLLTAPVALNAYVTVIGEVIRFDADEITRRTQVQLSSEIAAAHTGKAVIVATSVLNAAGVDLAKRLPAPITPAEDAFDKLMKRVNPAFAAARQAVTDANVEAARTQAGLLKQAFGETEAFWKLRAKPDASKWASDARGHADALDRAAAAADWDAAKAATASLQGTCSACHGAYRERFDDGSYRIRGEK
jgi:hypothetical protein